MKKIQHLPSRGKIEEPSSNPRKKNWPKLFKVSKLGPKVLSKKKNQTTLV
jgi:hypothetical protein